MIFLPFGRIFRAWNPPGAPPPPGYPHSITWNIHLASRRNVRSLSRGSCRVGDPFLFWLLTGGVGLIVWCPPAPADVISPFWCDLLFFSVEPAQILLWPTFLVVREVFRVLKKRNHSLGFFPDCKCFDLFWSFFHLKSCQLSRWESL